MKAVRKSNIFTAVQYTEGMEDGYSYSSGSKHLGWYTKDIVPNFEYTKRIPYITETTSGSPKTVYPDSWILINNKGYKYVYSNYDFQRFFISFE
jgi:hypothetical protein